MSLPALQNMWIGDPTIENITKLKDMKCLKYLTLGKKLNEKDPNQKLDKKIWSVLSKLTGLVSITIRGYFCFI